MKLSFKTAEPPVWLSKPLFACLQSSAPCVLVTDALIAYSNLKRFISHSEDKINIKEPI